jgi:hypothetical protein
MKKLAIVCGSPSSEMKAPFEDPDYEVWVLGNRAGNYPRFDLIFEIHDDLSQHDERYAEWLVQTNVPMVVGEKFPIKADHIEVYPYEETRKLLDDQLYLTSSPSMMIALAILRGFEHIELYGVDMAYTDAEYFWQRPCMEAWIGYARGRGLTVLLHDLSPVLKAGYVEGRDYREEGLFSEDALNGLADRHAATVIKLKGQRQLLDYQIQSNNGAEQAYRHLGKVARAVSAGNVVASLKDTVMMKQEDYP